MQNNINKDSASYSMNFTEHIVAKKSDAKTVFLKSAIITGGVLLTSITMFFKIVIYIAPMIALVCFYTGWFLWRYVSIEYEYTIVSGEIEVEIIYGKRQRKRIALAKIRDMEIIAPLEEKYLHHISRPDIKNRIFAAASLDSPSTYFAIYNDSKKGKTLLYFDAIKKSLDLMKYYNSSATVVKELEY